MRLILILSFFFSSVLDACLAEEILQSVADTVGIESTTNTATASSTHVKATFASTGCSDKSHSSHDGSSKHDTCHHCHSCHTATPQSELASAATTDLTQQSLYAFSAPIPHYKTLKRPPKA